MKLYIDYLSILKFFHKFTKYGLFSENLDPLDNPYIGSFWCTI